ncbi:hydroxymethylglutaryl-CoA lyase [Acinetobacter sp. UBA1297]|uniref:hydroxymethylglutaryl-CoA lyase n=1 Tax=Acinetobacter sp. UBA1297 TaxID=1945925 RepID=UPI00257F220F|nr:hydroxymethylglutaryl-CoA lyase [Acinetobacter sp. UBA1297]
MNESIRIVEVGARDGLQNEKSVITFQQRYEFLTRLMATGIKAIEVGSCVSAKWVPQMANSDELYAQLPKQDDISLSLLTPNLKGFEAALQVKCQEIAVFTAASESFTQKNINCSIQESLERFQDIIQQAKQYNIRVRGYVSCMVDCPYEGAISPQKVAEVAKTLYDMGCYEVSLGETIGTATPLRVRAVWKECFELLPKEALAGHFHDTYGMAITNIYESIQQGIRSFDSSISGLGGCPYAKGASGNVATEDVYYLVSQMGFYTGIQLEKLMAASDYIAEVLHRPNPSKFAQAYKQKLCTV